MLKLTLDSNRETAGPLSELLQQFGAMSVSLTAVSDENLFAADSAQEETLWHHTRVSALLHEDTDLDVLLPLIRQRLGLESIHECRIEHLTDRDWVSEFEKTHGAQVYAGKLCVCPQWCTPPESAKHVLVLDPGLAFGTGSHETTGLCLEWLAGVEVTDKVVIDYGCGSGILALSALLLGAGHAWAVDIDEQSLDATRNNAAKNRLQARLSVGLPDEVQLPQADVLLANILLNPLKNLAPYFAGLVKTGGRLALSGILAGQADDCLAAYQSWFNMNEPVFKHEWALLTGVRK